MAPPAVKVPHVLLIASGVFAVTALAASFASSRPESAARRLVQEDTVHIAAFDLPISGFLSQESRNVLRKKAKEAEALVQACPTFVAGMTDEESVRQTRACLDKYYYPPIIARQRARYLVTIKPETIGGIPVQTFRPAEGVPAANQARVLINLHGGGFLIGARYGAQVESIPIAALGKIRVVSVEYRMAPEYRYPAATQDVAAVYKALLADYAAQNIGIYGCSAGGTLTAEAVAWFQKHELPPPGAIGVFCAGAYPGSKSDSTHFAAAINGSAAASSSSLSYFRDANLKDPLAFPAIDPRVLSRFPPTLMISATRDQALSSVIVTHAQLVKAGVQADLHVWEGLGHGFFFESDLPESREAYDVIARFFDSHLGRTNSDARRGS